MTCIAAVRTKTGVVIGGDSAGVGGYSLTVRKDPKVFVRDGFAMGFTSSFRMGQVLAHAFKIPKPPARSRDLYRFMVMDFVDALRASFKERGFAVKTNDQESGGCFLVGVRNRIFQIETDYQVGEAQSDYDAVGCGSDIALGSLCCSVGVDPFVRVDRALKAAERHSAGVRAPFKFVSVGKP